MAASDEHWMRQALQLAREAQDAGEVPVGAILVRDDMVLATGFNQPISQHDPTAHAEMVALRQAAAKQGNYRLVNTTLFVTLEPCMMCAGALVHARIQRLVYGASEPKAGAITHGLLQQDWLNHRLAINGGVLANECGNLLSTFFAARRRVT